jgi:biopolymer transport protein ExbB
MWPILIVSIVSLFVVIDRCIWWGFRWFRRDPKRVEKVFTALETGDVNEASKLARGTRDPVLRMLWNGLNHQHSSLQGALQVAAGIEIKRAGHYLVVMDTLVTLAPLLGLLGTITGSDEIVQLARERRTRRASGHRRYRGSAHRDGLRSWHRDFRAGSV